MKHDDREKRFRKQRSIESGGLTDKAGPTLREFWAELQRAGAAGGSSFAVSDAASGGTARAAAACSAGSFRSSGSGSGGAGYGLALVAPDPESQERIRRIMQSLCEQDAKRGR